MSKEIHPSSAIDLGASNVPAAVLEQQRRFQMAAGPDALSEDEDREGETIAAVIPSTGPEPRSSYTPTPTVPTAPPGITIAADKLVSKTARVSCQMDSRSKSELGILQLPYVMFTKNENGFTFITALDWQPKLTAIYTFEVEGEVLKGLYAGSFFPLPGNQYNILSFILTEEHD